MAVRAQVALECGPQYGLVHEMEDYAGELGREYHPLTPDEADRYIEEVASARPKGSEGRSAILLVFPNGNSMFAMVDGNNVCSPFLPRGSGATYRGVSAALGRAV